MSLPGVLASPRWQPSAAQVLLPEYRLVAQPFRLPTVVSMGPLILLLLPPAASRCRLHQLRFLWNKGIKAHQPSEPQSAEDSVARSVSRLRACRAAPRLALIRALFRHRAPETLL